LSSLEKANTVQNHKLFENGVRYLTIICLVKEDDKLDASSNHTHCLGKGLWIHVFTAERKLPNELKCENILGRTLNIPLPAVERSLHVILCRDRILTWGVREVASFVRRTMESCIKAHYTSISNIVEAIIYSVTDQLYESLGKLESKLDTIEETLSKSREVTGIMDIFKGLRKIRRSAMALRTLANKARIVMDINRSIVSEISMLIEHLENLYDRLMMVTQFNYIILTDRTNNIVQKLTVISSIFLPLTLIASIYGMNFKYMPELNHPLAYPIVLAVMALIAITQLIYFRKKGWI